MRKNRRSRFGKRIPGQVLRELALPPTASNGWRRFKANETPEKRFQALGERAPPVLLTFLPELSARAPLERPLAPRGRALRLPAELPASSQEPVGTRGRESRACTGGRPGRPHSLGAQPTPPPRPLPCPGGGPRLTGKSCGRQPHVVRQAGAAGERGGGIAADCLPVPGYPAKPRAPGTREGTPTGAREKRPPKVKTSSEPESPGSKAPRAIQRLRGLTPRPSQDQTEAGTRLTLPRTSTSRTARLRQALPPRAPQLG